jgi:hypothetical protein
VGVGDGPPSTPTTGDPRPVLGGRAIEARTTNFLPWACPRSDTSHLNKGGDDERLGGHGLLPRLVQNSTRPRPPRGRSSPGGPTGEPFRRDDATHPPASDGPREPERDPLPEPSGRFCDLYLASLGFVYDPYHGWCRDDV